MVGFNNTKTKQSPSSILFLSTTRKVVLAVLVGLVISAIIVLSLNRFYASLITQRITAFALSVEPSDVEKLKDMSLSDGQVPYEQIKTKLHNLKNVYPETRFVYLMDRKNGEVSFLADSEPADSPDYSPRGEAYPDATNEDKAIFDNKVPFVEGPVSDDYGTWYSALAPVLDKNGNVVAVMGMDVPVSTYAVVILSIGLTPFLIALGIAGAVIFYDMSRRQQKKTFQFQIELTSIASHELSTPLSGIRLSEESLLKDQTLADSQKRLVGVMYESTLRMQESVEDILQLASLSDKQPLSDTIVALDLGAIIRETVQVQTLAAQEKSIQLIINPSVPERIIIDGDVVHMRRVFNNIISSNIQSSDRPGALSFTYEQKDDHHVIAIKNNGVNNAKQKLAQVTSASQGMSGNGRVASSVGMSLFLTRALVTKHKGELRLEQIDDNTILTTVVLPISHTATAAVSSNTTQN